MPSSEFYMRHYGAMADGHFQHRYVAAQKGNGFFGRIIKGSLIPVIKSVLPYLKDIALDGVGGLVDDIKNGKSFKEATSGQLKRTSETVLNDMAKRVKQQSGTGIRRRRQKGSGFRKQRGSGVRHKTVRGKRGGLSRPLFKV